MAKFLTPVLGEDYLIDHYAILGIPRDADTDDIKSAYREQMKQYHPDVVARAAPEIQQEAEKRSKLIALAYHTLSNSENKASYDEQLAGFDPRLISDDGRQILDLSARRINADYLVSGSSLEDKADMIQRAKAGSGHDETVFKIIKEQYEANHTSQALKDAYRSVLEKRNCYLALLDSFEWEDAGIANQSDPKFMLYPDDLVAKRDEHMANAEQEIANTLEKRILALSSGVAPKLLTSGKAYDSEDAQKDADALKNELTGIAVEKFKSHTGKLKEIAKERAEVMEGLVQLTEWEYHPAGQQLSDKLLVLLESDKVIIGQFMYQRSGDTIACNTYKNHDFSRITLEELASDAYDTKIKEAISSGINIALVHVNKELDFMMQTTHVAGEHFDSYDKIPK